MNSQLVSIIIPTYNRAHLIGETLDSIIVQSYKNWECLVIDDGSDDDTENILNAYLKQDSRFKYYKRPSNKPKGANACRNYGFEISKGEFINWFDDDDLMHPDKLKLQVESLKSSNTNFSVCQTAIFKENLDNILGLRSKEISSKTPFESYVKQDVIWLTQPPLWRRSFLNTLDRLFDEELQAAQEWEFHCRVLYNTKKYATINTPLVYIRQHAESITYQKDNTKILYHYFLARYKLYINPSLKLNTDLKQFLSKVMLDLFKEITVKRKLKTAFNIFNIYINTNVSFSFISRLYAVLSIFSFYFFGKGYKFLNKVKF